MTIAITAIASYALGVLTVVAILWFAANLP